jgi:hypothetical protein
MNVRPSIHSSAITPMKRKVTLTSVGALLLTIIVFNSVRKNPQLLDSSNYRDQESKVMGLNIRKSPIQVLRKNQRNKPNQKKLDELIGRWKALPTMTDCGWKESRLKNAAHFSVIQDAIDQLLCSDELIEFVQFLESHINIGPEMVERILTELFQTPRANELRASLIELANRKHTDDLGYFINWLDLAGKYCPKESIKDFHSALNFKTFQFNVLGFYNIELAKTDPIAAIQSSVEEWRNLTEDCPGRGASVQVVMSGIIGRLPAETIFSDIEKKFPINSNIHSNDDLVRYARDNLFYRWATFDQLAATNYIIDNQERLPLKILQSIGGVAFQKEGYSENSDAPIVETVKWIQSFPDGPIYDNLSRVVIMNCADGRLDLAKQLAARVQDKTLRDEANETIARWSRPKSQDGHAR